MLGGWKSLDTRPSIAYRSSIGMAHLRYPTAFVQCKTPTDSLGGFLKNIESLSPTLRIEGRVTAA